MILNSMLLTATLASLSSIPIAAGPESHVVSMIQLREALSQNEKRLDADREEVRALLRSELVISHLSPTIDLDRVEVALETLDDETLHKLAARSRLVNDQLRGGMPQWATSLILLYIIVAILLIIILSTGGS